MTVQQRLTAMEQQITLLHLALVGKESPAAPAGIDSAQLLGAVKSTCNDLQEHVYWVRCALKDNGVLTLPAPTDDEADRKI